MTHNNKLLAQYQKFVQEFNDPNSNLMQQVQTMRQIQSHFDAEYTARVEKLVPILESLVDDLVQEMIDSFPSDIIWNLHRPGVDYSTFYNEYDEPTGIYDDPRMHITASYSIKVPNPNNGFFGITGFPESLYNIANNLWYELSKKE